MSKKGIYYDNTMVSDYKDCPRKYYMRHVRGWRSDGTAMPLVFGLSWHDAMDVIWGGYKLFMKSGGNETDLVESAFEKFSETWLEQGAKPWDEMTPDEQDKCKQRTPMVAKEMLGHYIEKRRFVLEGAEVVAIEEPFAVPLYPDRPNLWYIGRKDKKIKFNGETILLEHKTTSEYKIDGGFKQNFIDSFFPNSQVDGYLYADNMRDPTTKAVWVDAALVHKKVHDAFKFIPVMKNPQQLDAWLFDVRDWVHRIEEDTNRLITAEQQVNTMVSFPKNTSQCEGKYGPCPYRNICTATSNPESIAEAPPGFREERWEPFDILGMEKLGMEK